MKTQFRNILFVLLTTTLSNAVMAQESEQIQSDRPGQANSANTVGAKNLQFQMGFNHNNDMFYGGVAGTFGTRTNSFSPLFRIGLFQKTEIGLAYNYASSKNYLNDDQIGEAQHNGSYSFSIRQNVLNGKNNLGLLAGYSSDFTKNFRGNIPFDLVFQALSSHSLSDRFGLSTNLIYNVNVNPTLATSQNIGYVLNLGYSVTDKIGVFIENYEQFGEAWRPLFDGGMAYLINNDFQLDISAGYGPKNDTQSSYFIDFGLSYRFRDILKKRSV